MKASTSTQVCKLVEKLCLLAEGLELSDRYRLSDSALPPHLRNEGEVQHTYYTKQLICTIRQIKEILNLNGGDHV